MPLLRQGDGMSAPWLESGHLQAPAEDDILAAAATALAGRGVARVPGRWPDPAAAWRMALRTAERACGLDPLCAGLPSLEVLGEFTLPPPGVVQRDFQALHLDYGMPKLAGPQVAISRFTALYLDGHQPGSRPMVKRSWLPAGVEGILARIIEAADQSGDLPDRHASGFLCGMEFPTLDEEHQYFTRHVMRLADAEQEIVLSSGELVLFDNLAIAHGRRGRRSAGELHQLCIGFGSIDLASQATLLDRILTVFDQPRHPDAASAESPLQPASRCPQASIVHRRTRGDRRFRRRDSPHRRPGNPGPAPGGPGPALRC
jgi:hypothetical protein